MQHRGTPGEHFGGAGDSGEHVVVAGVLKTAHHRDTESTEKMNILPDREMPIGQKPQLWALGTDVIRAHSEEIAEENPGRRPGGFVESASPDSTKETHFSVYSVSLESGANGWCTNFSVEAMKRLRSTWVWQALI
jgi:hypothetical protein